MSFDWKGKEYKTYSEIIDEAFSLEGKEQEEFVEAYAKAGPHALSNIGYYSGYYAPDKMAKIQEVFKTAHPIFGRRTVSPEEAFEKGRAMGEQVKK